LISGAEEYGSLIEIKEQLILHDLSKSLSNIA
jgi:hypothetical protein